jgi:molybdopterin-binding protein
VYANITEQSLEHLEIRERQEVFVSFKATAVKFIEA